MRSFGIGSSDVHGPASGPEPGRAELFWAGPSRAPEAAHQRLRPASKKVQTRSVNSGHALAPDSPNFDLNPGKILSLEFCTMLTQSFSISKTSSFPSNGATLIAGICHCMDRACNTTSTPFPPNHREPNTIAFQKVMAKQLAISTWQARWCNTNRHPPCPPQSSPPPSPLYMSP